MNQNDALPLKDIHLPDAVFWWPPAIGWWLLTTLSLLVLATMVGCHIFRKKRKTRQHLLSELSQIRISLELTGNTHQCARDLSKLLKQLALHFRPDILPAAISPSPNTLYDL